MVQKTKKSQELSLNNLKTTNRPRVSKADHQAKDFLKFLKILLKNL